MDYSQKNRKMTPETTWDEVDKSWVARYIREIGHANPSLFPKTTPGSTGTKMAVKEDTVEKTPEAAGDSPDVQPVDDVVADVLQRIDKPSSKSKKGKSAGSRKQK